jgi:phage terminase small subunit
MGRPTKPNSQKSPTAKPSPELKAGTPVKPTGLSVQASAEWDRLSSELAASGIQVTVAHRAPLTIAATIAADLAEGWKAVQEDGPYITTKTGLQAHPATKRIDALRRDYVKVLGMLGLRAAVSGGAPDEETLEDILNG